MEPREGEEQFRSSRTFMWWPKLSSVSNEDNLVYIQLRVNLKTYNTMTTGRKLSYPGLSEGENVRLL